MRKLFCWIFSIWNISRSWHHSKLYSFIYISLYFCVFYEFDDQNVEFENQKLFSNASLRHWDFNIYMYVYIYNTFHIERRWYKVCLEIHQPGKVYFLSYQIDDPQSEDFLLKDLYLTVFFVTFYYIPSIYFTSSVKWTRWITSQQDVQAR